MRNRIRAFQCGLRLRNSRVEIDAAECLICELVESRSTRMLKCTSLGRRTLKSPVSCDIVKFNDWKPEARGTNCDFRVARVFVTVRACDANDVNVAV